MPRRRLAVTRRSTTTWRCVGLLARACDARLVRAGFLGREKTMRVAAMPLVIVLAACSMQPSFRNLPAAAPTNDSETTTVRLSTFAFDPNNIRLKADAVVRLRIVNESDGGHNFSAPALFAASSFLPSSTVPSKGEIEIAPHETVDVALVPHVPGTYPLECTHFLHSVFGMHGTIEVAGQN